MIKFFKKPIFSYGIFWTWNFIFLLLLVSLEANTFFLFGIIKNAFIGYTPLDFSLYSLALFMIPIGSIILGFTVFRKKPEQLLRLFYGVEIPLFLLFILRISVFRELTGSTTHLLVLLTLGMISYFSELITNEETRPQWLRIAQKIGHALLLIIGLYIGAILIFYAVPSLWGMLSNISEIEARDFIKIGFWIFISLFFFFFSATLFIFLPIALVSLYIHAFIRNFRVEIPFGKVITFSTIGINLFLLFSLNYTQPQTYAFETLELDFSDKENRITFIENQDEIKKGLLNAYLSSYRYISSVEDNNHIKKMYKQSFNLERETAKGFQSVYNFFINPFLYHGDMRYDRKKSKELYETFFDTSIQKGEAETILKALKTTWDSDGIEAGLLNINQEKVHINLQEINMTEEGNVAEIEIHEVYENRTFSQQEIFYYFSLPSNSTITGLWLSDDEEAKKYGFTVSPRGAAQQVYKNEVRRRVDPSLLEQVGPNQYRLRAFPIEQKSKNFENRGSNFNDYEVKKGPNFHLWLSYKTIKTEKGWKLPMLLEKRNVYWSENTSLSINGETQDKSEYWLPSYIKSEDETLTPIDYTTSISESVSIQVQSKQVKNNLDLSKQRIALLLDGSYSMHAQKENLIRFLTEVEAKGFNPKNIPIQVISNAITPLPFDQVKSKIKEDQSLFFGSSNNMSIVDQFLKSKPYNFDLLMVLTDKGNYESSSDSIEAKNLNTPLFIHHLGNEQTPIYNDAFLETMQNSKGGIIKNIDDLINQLNLLDNNTILKYDNGIEYSLVAPSTQETPEMSAIATNAYIQNYKIATDSNRITDLDFIHSLALKEQIVTPYSSMIVLVNDRQKEALKKAEAEADRFDREVESGDETATSPSNPFNVSGTPEPHEWILIGLVFLMLAYKYYSNKVKVSY